MSPLLVFTSVLASMVCVLSLYALHKKGDVRIHISRGCFDLEAKDRNSEVSSSSGNYNRVRSN
jgi:hypothetical protein